jgi:hypothetical protein
LPSHSPFVEDNLAVNLDGDVVEQVKSQIWRVQGFYNLAARFGLRAASMVLRERRVK